MNSQDFHISFMCQGTAYNLDLVECEKSEHSVEINGVNYEILGDKEKLDTACEILKSVSLDSISNSEDLKGRLSLRGDVSFPSEQRTDSVGKKTLNTHVSVPVLSEEGRKVENSFRPLTQNPVDTSAINIVDRMKQLNIPGASIAVIEGGELQWSKGYGTMEGLNKQSQVASISKTVNALTMMSLIDKGHPNLDRGLDTDVRDILGNELMDKIDPKGLSKQEGRELTIRRLLSHTAGVSTPVYPGYQCRTEMEKEIAELERELKSYETNPNQEILEDTNLLEKQKLIREKIAYLENACKVRSSHGDLPTCEEMLTNESSIYSEKVGLIGPPGGSWEYSGGGAQIIQRVIELLTDKDYEDVVKERVFDRLDMDSSGYSPPESLRSYGYGRDGEPIPGKWHDHPELAAAGLWSTAADLAKLAVGIQKSAFKPDDKHAVISGNSGRDMWTPIAETPDGNEQHGLGVFVKKTENTTYAYHTGDNNGYRSVFFINEDGNGAAIVIPSENGDLLMKEAIATISDVYDWKDRDEIPYIQPIFTPSEFDDEGAERLFDNFRGEYHFLDPRSNDHIIVISGSKEKIQMTIDGDRTELVPVSNNIGYFQPLGFISNQYSARELRPPGFLPGGPERAVFEEELDGSKSITIFGGIKHVMK